MAVSLDDCVDFACCGGHVEEEEADALGEELRDLRGAANGERILRAEVARLRALCHHAGIDPDRGAVAPATTF